MAGSENLLPSEELPPSVETDVKVAGPLISSSRKSPMSIESASPQSIRPGMQRHLMFSQWYDVELRLGSALEDQVHVSRAQ